jgi:hypothetical protein
MLNPKKLKETLMAQKVLVIGLAERTVIASILHSLEVVDLDTVLKATEVRRALDLKTAEQELQVLLDEVDEKLLLASKISDEEKRNKAFKAIKQFSWDDYPNPVADFGLDESYLMWLQELLRKKDWSKQVINGQEVRRPVSPSLMEVIANTSVAISKALN